MAESPAAVLDRPDLITSEGKADGDKPPRDPNGSLSPDILPIRVFELPKTPAEFRAALGLPEQPPASPEDAFEKKRERVEGYVARHSAGTPRNMYGNGEQNLNYEDGRLNTQLADRSFSTRVWRGWMKGRLGLAGVKHAGELLQTIEGSVHIGVRKDLEPGTLVRLIKTLDPKDESEGLRKLNLAFDRARQFYIIPRSGSFKYSQEKLIEFINVLGNTPEDKWQQISSQLERKTAAIYHDDTIDNGLVEVVKQGGLTPELQQILTRALVWKKFADTLPLLRGEGREQRGDSPWLNNFHDLLNSGVAQQIDKYYPYLIDWAAGSLSEILAREAGRPPSSRGTENCVGRDFIVGLQSLESKGKLAYLNTLTSGGWDCQGIYRAMKGLDNSVNRTQQLGQIDQTLTQALKFQSGPDNEGWVKAIGEYFYGTTTMHIAGLPIYENMVNNKETLVSIALILNSLPKTEGFKPGDFLKMENGEVKIDRHELNNHIEQTTREGNITDFDKRYINGLMRLMDESGARYGEPKYVSNDRLSLYLYLAVHKERVVPQIFDSGGNLAIDVVLINELISQQVPIEGKFLGRLIKHCVDQQLLPPHLKLTYFDMLEVENRVEALTTMPNELLVTLPAETQASIVLFRQLPVNTQYAPVFEGMSGLSKFIDNGKPTVQLVDSALAFNHFQEIRQFLTPELMSSFTPEQRQFYQGCLSLPPEIVQLMSKSGGMSEREHFFIDGKLAPALLRMVAYKGQGGEIDQLLAITDLSVFSPDDQAFWSFYKSNPSSPNIRSYLLQTGGNFSRIVANGRPTTTFLENAAQTRNVRLIREVLPYIKIDELPLDQQAFWETYPTLDQTGGAEMRDYLLQNRSQFAEFMEEGLPTSAFLNHVGSLVNVELIQEVLNKIDWDKMTPEDNTFWQYYSQNQSNNFPKFVLRNRAQFPQMVVNGVETPLFYQTFLDKEPGTMLKLPYEKPNLSSKQYQDLWRLAIGKEAIDEFLAVLPKATDEARNAFTRNGYDRASDFIEYLLLRMPIEQFKLNSEEFSVLTQYVSQFGLAKNETIYKYFRALSLLESKKIDDLPEEMKTLEVTSTIEMVQRISEVRKMVFGERQLTEAAELRNLTPFQIQLLANVTKYDSARFGGGNSGSLSQKINQFATDLERGLITPLPEGYIPETIQASSVKVEFNAEVVKGDYVALKTEILECIDKPPTVDQLKSAVKTVIERRIEKINDTLGRVKAEKAVAAMTRDLANSKSYLDQLDKVSDMDSLTLSLLGMNFSNEDRSGGADFMGIDSVMRRVILSKLYHRMDRSPGFIENTRIKLSKDEVTAEGIDEMILTVDEMVKNHVLSLDFGNKEGYWKAEVFKAIVGSDSLRKNFRRITERFNPHAEKLRQEQARFVKTQTGNVANVRIIPDRGLIGEMAGYLADVCYIRVADLLKNYSGEDPRRQLVIPYKFVTEIPGSNEPRFIGSVLVFETQTAKGEPSLLVRALDIPNESEIDISKFTESLLDKFAGVAARRGRLKVQVAGTPGTISNYSATTGHVLNEYVKGKTPDPVIPVFDFNGYNITNQIYTARTIP